MKTRVFKVSVLAASIMSASALAQQGPDDLEETFIVSSGLKVSAADTALSIVQLDEKAIRENLSINIGDTIDHVPGVNVSSFGPGVGAPVIRGQTGNRIRVLSNSLASVDAASVSPDHANGVEPAAVTGVEIIKGPATLLYGNGAIGGVVNVLDNRIPQEQVESPKLKLEQRYNSVNEGSTSVGIFEFGAGDFAFHIDGSYIDTDNIDIPGAAFDEPVLDEDGELTEGSIGTLENSDQESSNINIGGSFFFDKGFIGLTAQRLEKDYGIPPGAHGEEEGEEGEEEEEGEEFIRIDLERTRLQLASEYNFDGFWQQFKGHISYTDYEHQEFESIVDEGVVVEVEDGTIFSNEGIESRFTLSHREAYGWKGVVGLQFSDTEFAAIGEEAFIPRADTTAYSAFAVESYETDQWIFEAGLRAEQTEVSPNSACERDETSVSASGSAVWKASDEVNVNVGLAFSQRAGAVEELLSNANLDTCSNQTDPATFVVHEATGLIEFGDLDLDQEESLNLEVGVRKHLGKWTAEFNAYYNQISDFIFLDIVDTAFLETELGIFGVNADDGGFAAYRQEDADFVGFEFTTTYPLELSERVRLNIELFGEYVSAELDNDANVPRIPAARGGVEFAFLGSDVWAVKLRTTVVDDQDDVAPNESETSGFTLVDLYADYRFDFGNSELVVFASGNNLLDDEIRNHVSFLNDIAPEPGRGVELGLRYSF